MQLQKQIRYVGELKSHKVDVLLGIVLTKAVCAVYNANISFRSMKINSKLPVAYHVILIIKWKTPCSVSIDYGQLLLSLASLSVTSCAPSRQKRGQEPISSEAARMTSSTYLYPKNRKYRRLSPGGIQERLGQRSRRNSLSRQGILKSLACFMKSAEATQMLSSSLDPTNGSSVLQ